MDNVARPATPAHVWIVGALATMWNAFGAYDYTMTRMRNTEYLQSMLPSVDPQMILTWIDGFPIWAQFGWGLGVWGGLVGSLLLLARNGYAVPVLVASLLGVLMSLGWQLVADTGMPAELSQGAINQIMPLVIIAVAIGLFLYARAMRAKGLLR